MPETKSKRKSSWTPILPVPDGTPEPRHTHPVRGAPLRSFTYYNTAGELLGYVNRYTTSSGGVVPITLTWCRNDDDGTFAWRWIQFAKRRPLFGAEQLRETSGRIALLVADELTAVELRRLPEFAHYMPISWPGGRTKLGEVDYSPLRGQIVVLWFPHSAEHFRVAKGDPQSGALRPRDKQPWRQAARLAQQILREFGAIAASSGEAETTEELPDGWDPLRALDQGWDGTRLYAWYEAHVASREALEAAKVAATPTGPSGVGSDDWTRSLMRHDETQRLLPELHNVRLILGHHDKWRDVIYFDTFAQTVMKAKPPPFEGGAAGEWIDNDDSMSSDWLSSQCGIQRLKTSLVAEGVQTVANLAKRNPLQDFLSGLKHDGQARLETWLIDFLGAGPFPERMSVGEIERLTKYLGIVGRLWLLGAVKRALSPGCKFDYMLILEGRQGLGKSSAFQIIGGEWAMDTPFAIGDKNGMETIRGKWIVEIPELDSFHKAESTTAKSFLARATDRFRLPYAKRSFDSPRACVFGGTTNQREYLRDPTGNRRYLPVSCTPGGYDKEKLRQVREQLLAEAVKLVDAGAQVWPTREEEQLIRVEQRKREILDPWLAGIAAWLASPDAAMGAITRIRILRECLKIEASRLDERGMATRVGIAMERLGYERIEDKTTADRFRYEKRQSSDEGVRTRSA